MAAALRIELRLAESKSAVLTVIRYRYVAWAQGLEPRLTVLETVVFPLDDTHMAEEVGFEPTVLLRTAVFRTATLIHSDTPLIWLRGIESNYRDWGMSPASYL